MKKFTSQRIKRCTFSCWRLYRRRAQLPQMAPARNLIPLPAPSDDWALHRYRASRMR